MHAVDSINIVHESPLLILTMKSYFCSTLFKTTAILKDDKNSMDLMLSGEQVRFFKYNTKKIRMIKCITVYAC